MSEDMKENSPLYQRVNSLTASTEMKQFLRELVSITHNNSIRTYELSGIQDGIIHLIAEEFNITQAHFQNYVSLSIAIKEYHIHTGKVLSLTEAKDKFLPEGHEIGSKYVNINVYEHIEKDKQEQEHTTQEGDDSIVH